jgi:hypothetical protein
MKEQLSDEEIKLLFTFVESKNVHYKDVQYEIVDHLASAIEEKQEENPSFGFNRALDEVYSKFPITGFNLLIDAKQSALTKFWYRKFLSYLLSYFKMPKIVISGMIAYTISQILIYGNTRQLAIIYFILILFALAGLVYRSKIAFEFKKGIREKYLVANTYTNILSSLWVLYFYCPVYWSIESLTIVSPLDYSSIQVWFLSIYITIITLLMHAYIFEFPKMLKQELEEKYSHLNIKLA